MNDSYSVDFTGTPPQRSPEEREKVKQLMVDSFKVLAKSVLIKKNADIAMMAVLQFCDKYKGTKPEDYSWEERERITNEADALLDLWRTSVKQLKELDDEYEEVRKRVNSHYGKEIMPKREYPPGVEEMYKEILGEGDSDWWKHGQIVKITGGNGESKIPIAFPITKKM